jgi:FkbM family methyltransferase
MRLGFEDTLKRLVPARLYYPHKIAKEVRNAEPELGLLHNLVPPGCTAVDVGANRGYYSYALSRIARRVESFEPNPALARFARGKLGPTVTVHEVALSNRPGTATLYLPRARGRSLHLLAGLNNTYNAPETDRIAVRVATLDAFDFRNVGFIKIDTEGSEMDVVAGAARTIVRDRPAMVIELLSSQRATAAASIATLQREYGYAATISIGADRVDALTALREMGDSIRTYNVVFTPK